MENISLKDYQLFINNMSQLLSLSKLYNTEHPIFKDKLAETVKQLKLLTSNNTSLIMSGMGGAFFAPSIGGCFVVSSVNGAVVV
ncbi:MAG: hypothetical protein ABID83_03690, partial [Candidatus Omnitrophota bacterium]